MSDTFTFNFSKGSYSVQKAFPIRFYGKTYLDHVSLFRNAPQRPAVTQGGFKSRITRLYNLWGALSQADVEQCMFDRLHKFDIGGIIYQIVHADSGLTYFGITDNPVGRIKCHMKSRMAPSVCLHVHVKKYGITAFDIKEFARLRCPRDRLIEIERALIHEYGTIWPNGLNMI